MNKYEMVVILEPSLSEEGLAARNAKITELVERFGGAITKVDDWGKRRLAYEIEKKSEGFYYLFYFDAESGCPSEIEDRIRIMDEVLRFLIVRLED